MVLGFHSGNVRRPEILKALPEMLPFSLGFISFLGGHRPHVAANLLVCLSLTSSGFPEQRPKNLYGPQRPQRPPLCLWQHHHALSPLLALFQAHCAHPSSSPLPSQRLASHRLVCPDSTSPRYLLTLSAPSELHSIANRSLGLFLATVFQITPTPPQTFPFPIF